MIAYTRLHASAAFLAVLIELATGAPPGLAMESEQELQARIQREHNPVKKAKYQIRLGHLRLFDAINAYDQGKFEQGQALLAGYLEQVKSAWETLRNSGRQAARQPQGFKELDIGLREDRRVLEDLKHRLSYYDRGAAEKTAQEIDQIRNEVLRALFPAERPAARDDTFSAQKLRRFRMGKS